MKNSLLILCAIYFGSLHSQELLQEQVSQDISCIQHPNRAWVVSKKTKEGKNVLDVAIIGGGQTGLTMAFSMKQHNIDNIVVYDQNREDHAGSWINIGKMNTLRTPKSTTGPDLGIPVLSVKSWYIAKYGDKAWDALDYIPRVEWHNYLNWYRRVLDLPVEFEAKVGPIQWDEVNECLTFTVTRPGGKEVVYARKVILAVGLEGSGEWMVPDFVRKGVSKEHYAQAIEKISPEKFKDKDIAILGAGPNAFDVTLLAEKSGAKSITLFSKRPKLVNLHCFKWGEFSGFMKCFTDLPDDEKYSFAARMHEMGQPPVPACVFAALELPNFSIKYSSPWKNTYQKNERVVVETDDAAFEFDFLVLATGWVCDLSKRQELVHIRKHIATWDDKYTPPADRSYDKLLEFPYLGRGFQFTEKVVGEAPYLGSIFNMTGGGLLSNGFCAGTGLTGMKYSIDLITHEIVKQLFLEDSDVFYHSLDTYNIQDFPN